MLQYEIEKYFVEAIVCRIFLNMDNIIFVKNIVPSDSVYVVIIRKF